MNYFRQRIGRDPLSRHEDYVMNDNWGQSSESNHPRKSGGLLSKYKSQQLQNSPIPDSQPWTNHPSAPLPPGQFSTSPGSGYLGSPNEAAQPPYNYMPQPAQQPFSSVPPAPNNWPTYTPDMNASSRPQSMFSNTMDMVRRWSGKMASVAGYNVRPPAPPMELYRPPTFMSAPEAPVLPPTRNQPWKRSRAVRVTKQMRQRRDRWHKSPMQLVTSVLLGLLALLVIVTFSVGAYGYSYYQNQLPQVQAYASQHISQNTRIYDRNNTLIHEVYDNQSKATSGRRITVRYENIPQVMQDAMIAIEDHSFWTNSGIDPQGIVRAASTQYGGASTITQQVIKNLSHNDQYSINRKVTEAAMAVGLTQQYSKAKILEMYFNVAPFGSQDLGVESATEEYFGLKPDCKPNTPCAPGVTMLDVDQQTGKHDPILGLARASLLAGMPNEPVSNDPTLGPTYKQRALARQTLVLNAMVQYDFKLNGKPITADMIRQVKSLTAKMTFTPYKRPMRARHFVDWVVQQVEAALGNGDPNQGAQAFITGGFNIRTTIDVNLEEYVERAVTRHLTQPEWQKYPPVFSQLNVDHNVNDAAVVVMDAKTGEVLAMNGSANYDSTDPRVGGPVNAAVSGRAPGSTMKPLVYATAFQMGWYPGMVLSDTETYFPHGMPAGTPIPPDRKTYKGGLYIPPDYGDTYHNIPSSVRLATANSFNIPALKAMEYAGPENVLDTAKRMGITTLVNDGTSWALGTQNVPLVQMVGAYQTFADSGQHIPPQSVMDIWDNYGHSLYHYDPNRPPATQVLSPQVAYMMTSVLTDEPSRRLEFGIDHDLSFADKDYTCAVTPECQHQVAAKTGTTDKFVDNLTIGYTADAVVGVWAGNANGNVMNDVIGITGAAPIWHSVMERTMGWCNQDTDQVTCGPDSHFRFSSNPQWQFTVPNGITKQPVSGANGLQGGGNYDWVLNNQAPLQSGMPAVHKDNGNNNNGDNGNNNGDNGNNNNGDNGNNNGDNGNNNGNNGNN